MMDQTSKQKVYTHILNLKGSALSESQKRMLEMYDEKRRKKNWKRKIKYLI